MKTIKKLSDDVINKIAAGEVVERPSSVVKELLENSIDAGAEKIKVEIVEGGTKSIFITDDGQGIRADELPLAVCRHATSKISSSADLFAIHTMGFRGEALAAISAVSKFTIKSRHVSETTGKMLRIENDADLLKPKVLPFDGPSGTTVMVEDLFHNVPARAKFLKRNATEYAHILELIQALSLINPHIDFALVHNTKEVFRAWRVSDSEGKTCERTLRERAKNIFKGDAEDLIYAEDESEYGSVKALVSPPGIDRNTNKHLFSFVNGRWVKDKAVRSGVIRGYHGHLLKGKHPLGVIVLKHDPSLVDVNAHPAKTEVRFQYPGEVGALIALAIRSAVRQGGWASSPSAPQPEPEKIPFYVPPKTASRPSVESSQFRSAAPAAFPGKSTSASSYSKPLREDQISKAPFVAPPPRVEVQSFGDPAPRESKAIDWQQLQFIGTYAKCYLIFEGRFDELLVVDQHAFHERILFERLTHDKSLLLQGQPLMIPELVGLTPVQVSQLVEQKDQLEAMSFRISRVTDDSVEVSQVPSLVAGRDLNALLNELSEKRWDGSEMQANTELMEHTLSTIACHSAVRSGEVLSENDLSELISQAETVDFYHNCPHGRRVFRWFKKTEVERWFDRI